jgi:hypothetical protein
MSLDEAEKDLRRDISVSSSLVPGLADDAAVVSAQRKSTLAAIVRSDSSDGSGDGGRGCSKLQNISN